MIPTGANFETAPSNRVAIYDVAHLLPRSAGKQYAKRDPAQIKFIVVHKTGADGPSGYTGCGASAAFQTRAKALGGRGWPGMAYTYWLPRVPDLDPLGRLAIYRCNADTVRSYHSGGIMNGLGIGIGVQGNYDGEWDLVGGVPRVDRHPTEDQMIMLDALVSHLLAKHNILPGLDPTDPEDDDYGLTGHWEHGKLVCPGNALRAWVCKRRGSPATLIAPPKDAPPVERTGELNPRKFDYRQRQQALKLLGADIQVTGRWNDDSRLALERFQATHGLAPDGWWGPATADKVTALLRANDRLVEDAFYGALDEGD